MAEAPGVGNQAPEGMSIYVVKSHPTRIFCFQLYLLFAKTKLDPTTVDFRLGIPVPRGTSECNVLDARGHGSMKAGLPTRRSTYGRGNMEHGRPPSVDT